MVVDESLFGRKTKTKGRGGALPARAAVISAAELRRIQGSGDHHRGRDPEDKDELEAIHAVKHKAARARKDRIRALAAASKNKAKKSTMELEKEARKETIRQMADKTLDENLDLVKYLRGIGARAAAFTIRDQQLNERGAKEARQKAYEDRMDLLMEVDRLRDLKQREDADNLRRKKRVEDRKVITEQIDANGGRGSSRRSSASGIEGHARVDCGTKRRSGGRPDQKVEQERRMEVMEATKRVLSGSTPKQRDGTRRRPFYSISSKGELMRSASRRRRSGREEPTRESYVGLAGKDHGQFRGVGCVTRAALRRGKKTSARGHRAQEETWRKNLAESVHKTRGSDRGQEAAPSARGRAPGAGTQRVPALREQGSR